METGDICPYCLDADCPSTKETCVGRREPKAPVADIAFCSCPVRAVSTSCALHGVSR